MKTTNFTKSSYGKTYPSTAWVDGGMLKFHRNETQAMMTAYLGADEKLKLGAELILSVPAVRLVEMLEGMEVEGTEDPLKVFTRIMMRVKVDGFAGTLEEKLTTTETEA